MRAIFFMWIISFITINMSGATGDWKNYADMKDIKSIAVKGDLVWAATTGGVFSFSGSEIQEMFTKSEGLSSQNLSAVAIDDNNNVWIGTSEGIINVFNISSRTFKRILDINRSDYTQKAINSIEIYNDKAYVCTDFGLSVIDVNTYEFIETVTKFGDLPSGSKVNSINLLDKIYVSTTYGLAEQKSNTTNLANPESWNIYSLGNSQYEIPAGEIYSTLIFGDKITTATDIGIFQLEGSDWLLKSDAIKVTNLGIKDSKLYFITASSLQQYDGTSFSVIVEDAASEFRDFSFSENNFYLATNKGVLSLNDSKSQIIFPNAPETNTFSSLSVDGQGNLWGATGKDSYGKGFMKFNGSVWTNYNKSSFPELPSNDYHRVFSNDNSVFLCNWGQGLTIYNDETFEFYNYASGDFQGVYWAPEFVVIMDVKVDNNDNTWVFNHISADNNPLIVFTSSGERFSFTFPYFVLNSKEFIDHAVIDDYNTKWFTINQRGLFYFNEQGTLENLNDDTWGRLNQNEYFDSREITSLAIDKRNEIWVGTSLGIKIIPDPSRPTGAMQSVFPLRQQAINCIVVDPLNQKWVGTSQGVFHVTSDGSSLIEQYDSKNSPLPSDDIKSIAIDENTGVVYIGTAFGLTSLTTNSVKPNKDFKELYVYPNPFIVSNGSGSNLTIDGLIENSIIKILTINGKLVREFETVGGRIDTWDGKDEDGQLVASGVYLIVAYDAEANSVETTKVAIIRK